MTIYEYLEELKCLLTFKSWKRGIPRNGSIFGHIGEEKKYSVPCNFLKIFRVGKLVEKKVFRAKKLCGLVMTK